MTRLVTRSYRSAPITAFGPQSRDGGRNYLSPTDKQARICKDRGAFSSHRKPHTRSPIMVRQLKHHEHKLLRKVDFFKPDTKQGTIRQNDVVRRVRS